MTMGCLREMATIWPQAAVHVRELQTIAQEVLGLSSNGREVQPTGGDDIPGSLTTVGPLETQPDGGLPFDLIRDDFYEGWDNVQPDLVCYDFARVN